MADSLVPNEINNKPRKYVQMYCVANLSGYVASSSRLDSSKRSIFIETQDSKERSLNVRSD